MATTSVQLLRVRLSLMPTTLSATTDLRQHIILFLVDSYCDMGTRSLGITSGSGRIRFVGLYSAAPIGGGAYWAITTHNVRDGLDAAVATRLVHRGGSRK